MYINSKYFRICFPFVYSLYRVPQKNAFKNNIQVQLCSAFAFREVVILLWLGHWEQMMLQHWHELSANVFQYSTEAGFFQPGVSIIIAARDAAATIGAALESITEQVFEEPIEARLSVERLCDWVM